MRKTAFILLFASSLTNAGDMTPVQMKQFCKLVDPTFLNRIPVIMQMKASGMSKTTSKLKDIRGGVGSSYASWHAVEAIYDSNATTITEAIAAVENACVNEMLEKNDDN